ncbi:ATP-binding protein [Variovorax robiniae]|uniref:ATP-binding protein n=1 Tax=Variovorax robiniae TaxID=1836199 RepID=UPI003BF5B9C0
MGRSGAALNAGLDSARWLIEHLLQAEGTDRAMRSVSHQMHAAKFPVHRDLGRVRLRAPALRSRPTSSSANGPACSATRR